MPDSTNQSSMNVLERLRRVPAEDYSGDYSQTILSLYQQYVEMMDRVSQRRQTANSFYLSVNTLFLGVFAVFGGSNIGILETTIVALAGLALCIMWRQNIHSYRDLNAGKFSVIHALEQILPVALYETEWEVLGRGTDASKYRQFFQVERAIPFVFILVYVVILVLSAPWHKVLAFLQAL